MPVAEREIYLGGCDIEWIGAKIRKTQVVFDGDDTVTFSLYASDLDTNNDNGDVLVGADTVTMDYEAGSTGNFSGPLLASVALVRDTFYWLEETATPDGGNPHTRRTLVQAVDRGPNP